VGRETSYEVKYKQVAGIPPMVTAPMPRYKPRNPSSWIVVFNTLQVFFKMCPYPGGACLKSLISYIGLARLTFSSCMYPVDD
jgi:hypothetical protein